MNIAKNHQKRDAVKTNSKFSLAERQQIQTEFWSISYDERESWLGRVVQTKSPARPRAKTETRLYTLFSASGENIPVCKTFFLSTLGLNSDKMIKTAIAKRKGSFIKIIPDQRGWHQPSQKLNDTTTEVIKNHIYSYGPSISHYRRAHTPNRLYLSPEFNISSMFEDFKVKNPDTVIHYSSYRAIRSLKISFVKLGEEECEMCDAHEHHLIDDHQEDEKELKKTCGTPLPKYEGCDSCQRFGEHIITAIAAREHYKEDARKDIDPNEIIMSVDLQ